MEFKLSKNGGDMYLAELSGALDLYSANQLKSLVMKVIENKVESFIISLKDVSGVNSAGVGALIYASSTLKKLDVPLVIVAPDGPVLHALEVTRLKSYFTVVSTLKEAVARASAFTNQQR